MNITAVKIVLCDPDAEAGVVAYATFTVDDALVVRDVKLLDRRRGLLLAMPSRKIQARCQCGAKNHVKARYCNDCGQDLGEPRVRLDDDGRPLLFADVVHPTNASARAAIEAAVVAAYRQELERAAAAQAGG